MRIKLLDKVTQIWILAVQIPWSCLRYELAWLAGKSSSLSVLGTENLASLSSASCVLDLCFSRLTRPPRRWHVGRCMWWWMLLWIRGCSTCFEKGGDLPSQEFLSSLWPIWSLLPALLCNAVTARCLTSVWKIIYGSHFLHAHTSG